MIPKWLYGKTIAVYDLETDFIPTTEIFCNAVTIIAIDEDGKYVIQPSVLYTQFWTKYSDGSLMEAIKVINQCDFACAHNLMGFDRGEVSKHLKIEVTPAPLDTLILSKIVFSKDDLYAMDPGLGVDKALWGAYSLKAFGQRFGDHKLDYTDFSHLNEKMGVYCRQDTDLAAKLLVFLFEKENFPLEQVVAIEHSTANIIYEQTEFGFYIDIEKTEILNAKLLKEKGELSRQLLDIFSPKFLRDGKEKAYKAISKTRKYLPNPKWIKPW